MLGFHWFKRLLLRRRREIFTYHDGTRWRYADPMVLDKKMSKDCPDWPNMIDALFIPDGIPKVLKDKAEATWLKCFNRLVAMVRTVFDVTALDEGTGKGLTEAECFSLLSKFLDFKGRLVEAAGPLSTSPAQPAASPSGLEVPGLTTLSSADSTSAKDESQRHSPELSPTV